MPDISLIKDVALFEGISEPKLEKIAEIISYKNFKVGETIFREGDKGSTLYIVLNGSVRLFRTVREEEEQTLAILRDGKFFGEMSLFEEGGHTATALPLRDTMIAALEKEDFEKLSETDPKLAFIVLKQVALTVCSILRDMDQKMIDMIKYVWEFGAKT